MGVLNKIQSQAIRVEFEDQELLQANLLVQLLDKLDGDEIKSIEPKLVELVGGDKQLENKFREQLIEIYAATLVRSSVLKEDEKESKIQELKDNMNKAPAKLPISTYGVTAHNGGYRIWMGTDKEPRPKDISNFTIVAKKILKDTNDEERTIVTINRNGKLTDIELEALHLSSYNEFRKRIMAMDNRAIYNGGKDIFEQHFQPFIAQFPAIDVANEQYLGLHFSDDDTPIFIYPHVDSGKRQVTSKTLTYSKNPDDHHRVCNTEAAKDVEYRLNDCDDETFKQIVKAMLTIYPNVNKPVKASITLAWFAASLLSGYLTEQKHNELPILSLEGNGGDGKNTMTKYCSKCLGHPRGKGLNLDMLTPKAIKLALSGSNAFPQMYEEMETKTAKEKTITFLNTLKSLYDGQEGKTGKLKGTEKFSLVNPAVILTNSTITDSALLTRMIRLEIYKSDWENSEIAQDAYAQMEEYQDLLNKGSYRLVEFFMKNSDQWDDWFRRAVEIASPHKAIGRTAKSLNAIAFGMVMLQELAKSTGVDAEEFFGNDAINSHISWLNDYLNKNKIEDNIEAKLLRFIAQKHDNETSQIYIDETNKGHVLISRADWIEAFILHTQKISGTRAYDENSLIRATTPISDGGLAKAVVKSIRVNRPGLGKARPTFYVIDVDLAKQHYNIDPLDWREEQPDMSGFMLNSEEDIAEQE